jgi:hypothetical protein
MRGGRTGGWVGCDWRQLQYRNSTVCSALTPYMWIVNAAQWCAGPVVGSARTWPTGRRAEEWMVRRPSVASLDSVAELTAYAAEPADRVGREAQDATSSWHSDGGRDNRSPGLGVPHRALAGGLIVSAHYSIPVARSVLASQLPTDAPAGGATRDIAVTLDLMLSGQVAMGGPRLATTYDSSVVDQQSRRWYVEDIRASTQPNGNPMTRFAPPGTLTDVHGREG